MSDVGAGSSLEAYMAREAAFQARAAGLHVANKAALFAVLSACGVTRITVTFDGAGDSGQIEAVEARRGEDPVELPSTPVQLLKTSFHTDVVSSVTEPLPDAIEHLVYDFLAETHYGWENNAGAFGEVVFEVGEDFIRLGYNERYEDSEYSAHAY